MSTPHRTDSVKFTTEELLADREASVQDISVCRLALAVGVTEYSGGLVQERIAVNERVIAVIDRILAERQIHIVTPVEGS